MHHVALEDQLEPITKQYGTSMFLTADGFVMKDNIGMGGHTITNLGTPTNNADVATKKYVDDKELSLEKQNLIMVNKKFGNVVYADNSGNAKGQFYTFQFGDDNPGNLHFPYNGGYGNNLTAYRDGALTKEVKLQKIPIIGVRRGLVVKQDKGTTGNPAITKITLETGKIANIGSSRATKNVNSKVQYGVLLVVKFVNDTVKALYGYQTFTTDYSNVNTFHTIKDIGSKTINGEVYRYFLCNVASDNGIRRDFSVEFTFTSSQLKNGKMEMIVYEGFFFNGFSDSDFANANLTTNLTYPHILDFDKHKFQDVTNGDVLLAGTKQVDGRILVNNEVGFKKVFSEDITSSSIPAQLVNLNSLQRGGLLGVKSFSSLIQGLFPHRLVMAKGKVGNFTVTHKDQTIFDTNGVTLTSVTDGIKLDITLKSALPNGVYKYIFDIFLTSSQLVKVFLYGQCGGTGYAATTKYEHWQNQARGVENQTNQSGGYFLRIHGTNLHFEGSFRNYAQKIVNYGKPLAMNSSGTHNEFVRQQLTTTRNVLLGNKMEWIFKNETAGNGFNITNECYFFIEKIHEI